MVLLQISKTDFKFSLASEHFNNSSLFSLATALCLTLHKNPYPLSAEKATQKTNIKVFIKGLLFTLLYEIISHLPPSPQGNMFRFIHTTVPSSIMLPNPNKYQLQENNPSLLVYFKVAYYSSSFNLFLTFTSNPFSLYHSGMLSWNTQLHCDSYSHSPTFLVLHFLGTK